TGPSPETRERQPILGRFLAAARLAWNLARRTLKVRTDPTGWGRVRMTDIDPNSDVELSTADGQVMVRIPLAGRVTGDWVRGYRRRARATEGAVQARGEADRAW